MLRRLKRTFVYQRKPRIIIFILIVVLLLSNLSVNFEIFHRYYFFYFYEHKTIYPKSDKSMFDLKGEQLLLKSECDCMRRFDKIIITKKEKAFEISRNNDQNIISSYGVDEFEEFTFTCDLYRNLRRGRRQKVIGISLFGKDHMFKEALISLIEQVKKFYPGWIIRVYHDNDKLLDLCQFECEHDNIDFCDVSQLPFGFKASETWSANHIHETFISRDADVCLIQREIEAVNEWLKSEKLFHIMRDNPEHYTEILGGMWGFQNELNRSLAKLIFNTMMDPLLTKLYNKDNQNPKNYDQLFLKDQVWHHAVDDAYIHDSYLCNVYAGEVHPYPIQRELNNYFIGMPTIGCPNEDSPKIEIEACPAKCRPEYHQDWLYC